MVVTPPTNVRELKEMIQRWADEEDCANTCIRNRFGPWDNNSRNDHRGDGNNYSRKRRPDNTVAAMHPKQNHDDRTKEGKQRSFEELLKKKCSWHPKSNHSAWGCYSLRDAFRNPPKHSHYKGKGKEKEDEDEDKNEGGHGEF
jgi:hypothetical protein